ncbi:MAG: S9 family peptidase [Firmicutes bacterium]|nr:S9 family peptidase [Bacillota bacterium]
MTSSKDSLRFDDYYLFKQGKAIAVSPVDDRIVYEESVFVKDEDKISRSLWLLTADQDRPLQITRGRMHDHAPRWSEDGRYLAFLSTRAPDPSRTQPQDKEDEDDRKTQVWLLDMRYGGEAWQLTSEEEGVASFSWAPDSRYIVYAARTPDAEQKAYLKRLRDKKSPGPWVIDRVQHKYDGTGFLDDVPTHLFVVDLNGTRRQITFGAASETDPLWSPDGQWILFRSNRTGDADNNARIDLWMVTPDSAHSARVTRGDVAVQAAAWSPDGRRIALISSLEPENAYVTQHLGVISREHAQPLVDLSQAIGTGWIFPEQGYPQAVDHTPWRIVTQGETATMIGPVRWASDRQITTLAADNGQMRCVTYDAESGEKNVLDGLEETGSVEAFDSRHGRTACIVNTLYGAEIVRTDSTAAPFMLNPWLKERALGEIHRRRYASPDGTMVQAVMVTPPRGQAPWPLIVNIHGGPMWFDAPAFDFDAQYWAGRGYMVLMVNYRGSISFGEDFCRQIQGRWGPKEFEDIMAGVDLLVREGQADDKRLFCTGFSQGGVLTNWVIGHTGRFQAAVSEHGLWDYLSAFGTDDCQLWWQDDAGLPWENPAGYKKMSPASAVEAIHTPLLITAGEQDWRCPLSQAEQLYLALKKRKVPTRLIVYPGEHHAISRPKRAIDRLQRIDHWFAAYGGIPEALSSEGTVEEK